MGPFHPDNVIDNAFLEDLDIGTSQDWILERVGIETRRTVLPLDYIRETKNQDPRQGQEAAEIARVRLDEVLFVTNHTFDCIGAKSAGMHTAFIDRRRRPFGATPHRPDITVPSMKALADLMA